MNIKNEKGLGLVEVVAALGISVVVITSLVSLTVFTLRSSQRSKALLEASKQANQTLELVRAFRDQSNNWLDGEDDDENYDGFMDILVQNNCGDFASACQINSSLVVSQHDPLTVSELQPSQIDVYFYTYTPDTCADVNNPDNTCSLDTSNDTVRIAVFSNTRMGDQLNTTSLYTDLTNWRQN